MPETAMLVYWSKWTLSYDLIMYCKLHGSGTFINSCVRDKI